LRVTNGEELFVQSGGTLYAISRDGAVKVADCEGCTFIPHSRERYALLTRDGLLLRFDGEERRLNLRPQVAKWSEDGSYLVALSGSTVSLISKQGLLWSVSLNTQVFDVDLSDSVVVVTTKNCEIYAYSIRGGMAWTNRLCSCCIPLKLASSRELVAVVLQGKEIALLDPASGRVLQRLNVSAYSAQMGSGLLAAVDSQGVVHIFADSGGLRVEGKSLGALLLWDLPEWLRGELSYEAGDEVGNVRISRESFIPLMSQGNLTLVLRDRSGVEVRRDVFVKPLEVKLTPDGHVEVRGDGALSIRSQGRIHEGTNAIVDTGFLPEYTVEILNYGVPVGKYSCYNSRFTLVAAAISAALLLAAVKLLSGGRRATHGAGDKG
ncbi:MAG: hypothetical protein BA066_03900, partial [Candidatus Korarchaeota archaeon NZ13-K]